MGLQSCNQDDLIVMDNQYLARIREREQTIRDHADDVVATTSYPMVRAAVDELYIALLRHHLPTRFPTVFRLCDANGVHVVNKDTATNLQIVPDGGRLVSLTPPDDPRKTLATLGSVSDDDHVLLFPSQYRDGDELKSSYTAHAYVFCCPAGFSPRQVVLNKPLAAIHAPVPGFAQRLQRSVDRYFDRLEPGRAVMRANWTVVSSWPAYTPHGSHMYEDEGQDGQQQQAREIREQADATDAATSFLRVERQTLQRLPRSGAIVFSLKTYRTLLAEVRAEGNGAELASAVEGLRRGNVPSMWLYKRAAVWADKVCAYLRDEDDGAEATGVAEHL